MAATAGLNMLAGWSRLSQALRVRPVAGRATQITTFDGSFERLHPADTSSMIGTWREPAYLNWRFVSHPLNQYDCVGWENSGKICGYIVTIRRNVLGLVATLVVDLAAASDPPGVEFALLSEVQRRSRVTGASLLATLAVAGSSRFHRLRRFGFLPVPRRLDPKPFLLTVHGLGKSEDQLTEQTAWHFNWADIDVV